ncbi:hypothetical protein K6H09_003186 [Candida tropicalis]
MVLFNDLPDEVVELIVEYLPPDELSRYAGLPRLGEFATNSMYSTIVINNNSKFSTAFELESYRGFPNLFYSEYQNLRKKNPGLIPKKLVFTDPSDAFKLVDSLNRIDEKIKIELVFLDRGLQYYQKFISEYKKKPFEVHCVSFGGIDDLNYYADYGSIPKPSYEIQDILGVSVEAFFKELFCNLSSISLVAELDVNELKLLPKSVEILNCRVKDIEASVQLPLPNGLKNLSIASCRVRFQNTVPEVDISHLDNVRNLKLRTNDEYSYTKWKLPSNVTTLSADYFEMIPRDLISCCPKLFELEIDGVADFYAMVAMDMLSIPITLRKLTIPGSFTSYDVRYAFMNFVQSIEQIKSKLKLPETLRSLNLSKSPEDGRIVILDFESNQLPALNSLNIEHMTDIKFVGQLPLSLTEVFITEVPDFRMNNLLHLQNLSELYIDSVEEQVEFSCQFSESLEYMSISCCGLQKVAIVAPKLKYLGLEFNKFKVLDEKNFIIPDSVESLQLGLNPLVDISVKFPKGLTQLGLSSNYLTTLPELPKGLKILHFKDHIYGPNLEPCDFPLEIEKLDLTSQKLSNEWFENSNLSKCSKLKHLSVVACGLKTLDLDNLPSSLVSLDLSNNQLTTIHGDFSRLENLEHLYLPRNELKGVFQALGKKEGPMFAPSIKQIDLNPCSLTKDDVETLFKELTISPDFEFLNVDESLLPESVDVPDLRLKRRIN